VAAPFASVEAAWRPTIESAIVMFHASRDVLNMMFYASDVL
jgi:hypothetical protein